MTPVTDWPHPRRRKRPTRHRLAWYPIQYGTTAYWHRRLALTPHPAAHDLPYWQIREHDRLQHVTVTMILSIVRKEPLQ